MFSIVMLTWNNYETFKRCITSMTPLILDERVQELIILDNGSHEIDLQKLLKATEKNYNKVKVIYSSQNLGIAKGRKYLYDLCKGEYILSFDSDVVIVNATMFMENFLKAISLPDMWLVGGGGGNHIFFPTIFRSDINNLPSPKEINQVTLVDEVAGWFHGFRSSMLVKNGGKIYMDERFTPFWGEDSDFCYQIKLLGGKCCILGHGNLGHAWSSCDKKENHGTLDVMWKKMTDKWYPTFGDTYKLDFDKQFFIDNYTEYKDSIDPREKYLLEGMKKGYVINKEHITKFYDVKFLSNTKLLYNNREYHTRDFIDKFLTFGKILDNNFEILHDTLSDNDNVFYIYLSDLKSANEYIKKELLKVRSSAVVLMSSKSVCETIKDFTTKHFKNIMLASFPDYHDNIVSFLMAIFKTKKYRFKTHLCLDKTTPINGDIHVKKSNDNMFSIDLIMDWYRYNQGEYFEKEIFLKEDIIDIIRENYPLTNILEIALRLPTTYSYNLSPRFSPRLALRKLVSSLQSYDNNKKALVLYLTKVEDSEKVSNNIKLLKESGNCEVVVINIGEEKFWSAKELGFDYYFVMKEEEFIFNNYFTLFNIIHMIDYSNIIFMNDTFTILEKIDEFLQHSYHHNIMFLKNPEKFEINMLSIVNGDVMNFAGMVSQIHKVSMEKKDNQEINIDKTIEVNMIKNFFVRYLWKEERVENDTEISIDYSKYNDLFTPEDNFPLDF